MGFHQCARYGGAKKHEGKLLSWDAARAFAELGQLAGKVKRGTGEGYSDISIQTPGRVGMIIELKYADDGNLEAACSEALKQIEERKYAEGLKRRGAKRILKYGIAFCEKECMVVMVS